MRFILFSSVQLDRVVVWVSVAKANDSPDNDEGAERFALGACREGVRRLNTPRPCGSAHLLMNRRSIAGVNELFELLERL
ncbi:MAG: hypothetical protein ABIP14_10755 [Blastocatellia bacterium]